MNSPLTADQTTNSSAALPPESVGLEKQFYHLLMQAPVAMVIFRGPEYIVEFANELYYGIVGKTSEQLLNKPAFVTSPNAVRQGFPAILDRVRTTAQPFRLSEHQTFIDRGRR
jgi:hypothetical protein